MSIEFQASFCIKDKEDIRQLSQAEGDFLHFSDVSARIALLAQAIALEDKPHAQTKLKLLTHIRREYDVFICRALRQMASLGLVKPQVNLAELPLFSFFLQFDFTLAKPYISQDDESFYIIDNPLKKDKVFKVPLIASTSWKGNLRDAIRKVKNWKDSDPRMRRLFGNEKEAQANFKQGRLQFYPTFLDQIDMEVINPHTRKTKAGINPIYFEVAPRGTKGYFSLLYIPFDLIGKPEEAKREAVEDLQAVTEGVRAIMLEYGFSAKKTSGYGVAIEEAIEGTLDMAGIELRTSDGARDNLFHSFGNEKDAQTKQTLWALVRRLQEVAKQ